MAADGSSCSTGSGQCAVIGYYHKDRYFRCDCYFLTYLFAQRILGNGHSAVWCDHDDAGRYSCVFHWILSGPWPAHPCHSLVLIFVGIGMQGLLGEENALAVRGTMLHMFNHSNLKLVLFMAAGVVVMNLHKLNLNDIRGFGRKKPLLLYTFLMGSLGIGGIPLFNGYVSKTLIHESIVEYIELLKEGHGAATFAFASGAGAAALFKVIEWLFIITGAMTVAYMTKLFIVLFVEKNSNLEIQKKYEAKTNYCNKVTAAVLAITATILPILGVLPTMTLDKLADMGQGLCLVFHRIMPFIISHW